jgi:hypothetical protein
MARDKQKALRLELAEAYKRIGTLKRRNRSGARAGSARHRNLFGFGEKKKPAATATPPKTFYVDFEGADGDVRSLIVEAANKTAALREAKTRLRADEEDLKGAKWTVDQADD